MGRDLQRAGYRGRFTEAASWHVTVLFLGERSEESLPWLLQVGGQIARDARCRPVQPTRLAVWPSWARPHVGVLVLNDPDDWLRKLHESLGAALHVPSDHTLQPHVTLMRLSAGAAPPRALPVFTPRPSWSLDRLVLYESILGPRRASYRARGSWGLAPAAGVAKPGRSR